MEKETEILNKNNCKVLSWRIQVGHESSGKERNGEVQKMENGSTEKNTDSKKHEGNYRVGLVKCRLEYESFLYFVSVRESVRAFANNAIAVKR